MRHNYHDRKIAANAATADPVIEHMIAEQEREKYFALLDKIESHGGHGFRHVMNYARRTMSRLRRQRAMMPAVLPFVARFDGGTCENGELQTVDPRPGRGTDIAVPNLKTLNDALTLWYHSLPSAPVEMVLPLAPRRIVNTKIVYTAEG